jgi:hypothetical protein
VLPPRLLEKVMLSIQAIKELDKTIDALLSSKVGDVPNMMRESTAAIQLQDEYFTTARGLLTTSTED